MPINLPTEPSQGQAVVAKALDDLRSSTVLSFSAGGGVSGPTALLKANPAQLTTSLPHPVYDLGLDAIVAGKGLEAAKLNGWRYVLEDGGKPFAFAELDGGGQSFTSFNTGGFPAALCTAVRQAEQLDYLKTHDAELRVLRISALYVIALWLCEQGVKDLVIPVAPVGHKLVAGRPYGADDFLDLLRSPAKRAADSTY
jgi:hypothetical protein